jgi:thiamine pyridinylase
VRPLAKSFGLADLAYEPDRTAAALTDESNPDFQHLVELDTLILGALAQRGAIAPFAVENVRFLPAAADAITWNNQTVGVPHWTCGYFVISEDPNVRAATNVFDLVSILRAESTPRVDLAGDLANPWDAIRLP